MRSASRSGASAVATTTTEFDRDTAVEAVGDGLWRATVSDQWAVPRGPNGGYIAALMLRAMEGAVGDPERAPRSLTLHYLRPPVPGQDATVHTTIEREGRTLVVLPERAVALNESTRELLDLCDGAASADALALTIARRHGDAADAYGDAHDFLAHMERAGVLASAR